MFVCIWFDCSEAVVAQVLDELGLQLTDQLSGNFCVVVLCVAWSHTQTVWVMGINRKRKTRSWTLKYKKKKINIIDEQEKLKNRSALGDDDWLGTRSFPRSAECWAVEFVVMLLEVSWTAEMFCVEVV